MNYSSYSLSDNSINSAKALSIYMDAMEREKNHRQIIDRALISTSENSKMQSEQSQKINELLVKQAEDSARDARISRWIAVVSLILSALALIFR